ncbi:AAA family ATPase [Butyrivibrio sp. XPD2002]|uniref:AAA family ATPase n=1 Tax=Butyrivibrio sp. XPD2002 TaxID=1280665 RepID=UPI0004080321|nr:AAA family ATPase [Butyrivibrio sp. XPD2002]
MYKIKSVEFHKHPILKDLKLDFCDLSGNPVDTVIIAGENGVGKSTVLDALYKAVGFSSYCELKMIVDKDGDEIVLQYYKMDDAIYIRDQKGISTFQGAPKVLNIYPFRAIFSDVDINFNGGNIQTITSSELDKNEENRRSTNNLPKEIKQLIVDIQSIDDAETAESYRRAIETGEKTIDRIIPGERMNRFTNAFNKMFDKLTYCRVENRNNSKAIVFAKGKDEIAIDYLSSGEKQIVYRGCFLLKDINAISGAFVFIDEPEISLHPEWQKKILDYYKNIFTDNDGIQTSQIFIVTHSPFIIHNKTRKKDKVIVLKRDEDGNIVVNDKPEYYECNSLSPIQDAFNIDDFDADTGKSVIYVEGRTDEKYFKKALEIFGFNPEELNIEFQWIGHLTKKDKEEFTGAESLNYGIKFMKGRNLDKPQFFLFDCDTKRQEHDEGNIIIMVMPYYSDHKIMNKGIENALELDNISLLDNFYETHTYQKDYGQIETKKDFLKMKFCDYICNMDCETQKRVLINLKPIIEKIVERVNKAK